MAEAIFRLVKHLGKYQNFRYKTRWVSLAIWNMLLDFEIVKILIYFYIHKEQQILPVI